VDLLPGANDPAPHGVQIEVPAVAEYSPELQGMQSALPAGLKVPSGHAVHNAEPLSELFPALTHSYQTNGHHAGRLFLETEEE
jgi:hypothetical protein